MKKFGVTLLLSCTFCSYVYATEYIPCAENEVNTCWSCGKTCSARLSYPSAEDAQKQKNATLTFSGTGQMSNYGSPFTDGVDTAEPWYGVRNSIKNVVVEEGITSVGNRTIYYMQNLKEVSLPETITSIGQRAFFGSSGLKELSIPSSVTSIGQYAFQSTKINELIIPENVTSLAKAFLCESEASNCIALPLNKIYCAENNAQTCANAVAHLGVTPQIYERTKNGDFYINGKFYQNLDNILSGQYIKKRIYTVEEATKISTPTRNTFKLIYR